LPALELLHGQVARKSVHLLSHEGRQRAYIKGMLKRYGAGARELSQISHEPS
jgi:hypothetical protein